MSSDTSHPRPLVRPTRRRLLAGTGLLAAAGFTGLRGLGCSDAEPLGPGEPMPWLTPVDRFYVTAGKELPPPLAESDFSLSLATPAGVQRELGLAELRQLASRQLERTLICDGAGFEIRSFGSVDNVLLHWDWRYAAIGNARWDCIPLDRLFESLGVELAGPFIRAVARDEEDWFYPVDGVRRGEILVAVGMNGAPLTHEHGAPARLVASGQYGRSALKWITRFEAGAETFHTRDFEGGTNHVPVVKPFAFASSPRSGSRVSGRVKLSGAAYAGTSLVTEVIVTNERAQQRHKAQFIDPPRSLVWRRWEAEVPVLPGSQVLEVSCTDSLGRYSELRDGRLPREPDGWDGIHSLEIVGA